MKIEVKDDSVLLGDKVIYSSSNKKIFDAQEFDENKIILILQKQHNNIVCIDVNGNVVWESEDAFTDCVEPYANMQIINGQIIGTVRLATVKIDPNTGKVIEKEYSK